MVLNKNQTLTFSFKLFKQCNYRNFCQSSSIISTNAGSEGALQPYQLPNREFIPTELNVGEMLYDRIKKSWYLAQLEMITKHYKTNFEVRHVAAMLKAAAMQLRKEHLYRFNARCAHVRNERVVRRPMLNRIEAFLPLPASQDKVTILKTLSLAKWPGRRGRVAGLIADLLRDIPVQIEAFSLSQKEEILYSCAHVPHIALHLPEIVCASVLQQLKSQSYNPDEARPRVMAGLLFSIAKLKMEEQQEELVDLILDRFLDQVDAEKAMSTNDVSLLLYGMAAMGKELTGELKYEALKAVDNRIEDLTRYSVESVHYESGCIAKFGTKYLRATSKVHTVNGTN
eukprot:TRINITY_DN6182_c1_g1_i4.p1 TRINITY_DN6182_c1_g1~~TRINITY_DN6182_c1_g1_i4.p1  ORF type:complete len:341 (-),score=43.53 TRINITY_DN6182_c1_g1_i4:202-1224(-)